MSTSRTRRAERRLVERQQRNQAALNLAPAEYLAMPRAERKNQFAQPRTCVVCRGPAGMTAECVRCRIDEDVRLERLGDI